MTNSLTSLPPQLLLLEDDSRFYFSVSPHDVKNVLGTVVSVVDKYCFTMENNPECICQIGRTNDGTWYDLEDNLSVNKMKVVRMLKAALVRNERSTVGLGIGEQDKRRVDYKSPSSAKE